MPLDTQRLLEIADRIDDTHNGHVSSSEYKNGNGTGGKWASLFEQQPEGGGPFNGRDNAITAMVGFLRAKSIPYEAGREFLLWWNDRYCFPPLEHGVVLDKVSRKWAEWTEGGMKDLTPEELQPKPSYAKNRVILTVDDLLDLEETGGGLEWLVPNVFVKAGIHFVSAPAAGAKSWLMLDLSRCIATGEPWLGTHEVGQGAVLYVDEEMGDAKTSKRVRQLGFGRGVPFYYLGKQGIHINDPADLKFIVETCKALGAKLVCLDTLTGVRPGLQENESSHVSQLRSYFNDITNTGATLLVAHHDRKGGQGESEIAHYRMAGSRDFGAMADMAYGIEKRGSGAGSYYHLEVTKNRLLSEEDCLTVDFVLEDSEDKTRVTLRVMDAEERSEKVVSGIEGRIIDVLRTSGPLNTLAINDNVTGATSAIGAALNRLVAKEILGVEKEGKAKVYRYLDL